MGLKAKVRVVFTLLPDGTTVMRAKSKSAKDLASFLKPKSGKGVPTKDLAIPSWPPSILVCWCASWLPITRPNLMKYSISPVELVVRAIPYLFPLLWYASLSGFFDADMSLRSARWFPPTLHCSSAKNWNSNTRQLSNSRSTTAANRTWSLPIACTCR
jgi:hypothetical protein